jgi:hypothetical protein
MQAARGTPPGNALSQDFSVLMSWAHLRPIQPAAILADHDVVLSAAARQAQPPCSGPAKAQAGGLLQPLMASVIQCPVMRSTILVRTCIALL